MKEVLFIFIAAVSLASCEKTDRCKKCETITIIDVVPTTTGYPQKTVTNFESCGDDLKKINEQPIVTTTTQYGVTVNVTTTTTCK